MHHNNVDQEDLPFIETPAPVPYESHLFHIRDRWYDGYEQAMNTVLCLVTEDLRSLGLSDADVAFYLTKYIKRRNNTKKYRNQLSEEYCRES